MTIKDPIRKAFEKWASLNYTEPDFIKRGAFGYSDPHIYWMWIGFHAALSLIPHAAEILSGEAEVVLKSEMAEKRE